MTNLDADYFDGWYADMAASTLIEGAKRTLLGLPPELLSTSLLSMSGLQEIRALLQLSATTTLLDLACGRGGYGSWLARETGCALVGVDFSGVAVQVAQERIGVFGLDPERATFAVGELVATGLTDHSVDAVMCIDAVQFADDQVACANECRRVLRSGGRVAFTCWEAVDRTDELVPERIRQVDLGTTLRSAGFADVEVTERPDWLAGERDYWSHAVSHDPGDDPALQSWVGEGRRSLERLDGFRRVLATATAP